MKRHIVITLICLLPTMVRPAFGADQGIEEVRRSVGQNFFPYYELEDAPTITVDWSKGNVQIVTLRGNRILQFTNGIPSEKYTLILKQDGTGSRTVTWPSSLHWTGENEQPPTLTTTANREDYITFAYNGATYDAIGFVRDVR